jgi:hypothetical protein
MNWSTDYTEARCDLRMDGPPVSFASARGSLVG